MGKQIIRVPISLGSLSATAGTWTITGGTASAIGYYGKTAADNNGDLAIPFAAPAGVGILGAKLLSVEVPMLVGTADMDAVLSGALRRYNVWKAKPRPSQTFTVNIDTNIITLATLALEVGQPVTLTTSGSLPGGLATSTTYYVGNVHGTNNLNCQLFTTEAAAFAQTSPIDLTSAGSGTHTMAIEAADVTTVAITEQGTQVTFSATPRRYRAIVTTPTWENETAPSIKDLFSYSLILTWNAAATTVLRVYEHPFAEFEIET